jgi:hypothetical protein
MSGSRSVAQISPGPLASVHSHLEGLSNCTKCHELGDKVTNAKCLSCHTELKARIDQNKGYHSSVAVRGKNCVTCHSDHHGVAFQIIRFNKETFDHRLAGYDLQGAHAMKACKDCHKPEFIANKAVKSKKFTYLGLNTACLSCHADYHQNTMSPTCTNCHNPYEFKPATLFSHSKTRFILNGQHQQVVCIKCHPVITKNGAQFQQFAGIQYQVCASCHADPHQNKFGQNCSQCHSEASFHTIKGIANFDHSKTDFPLENKHRNVTCKSCHKTTVTDPVRHDRCTDCHADYHENQFIQQGVVQNCSDCHSTAGFTGSSFTVERHNNGKFRLEGAHLATPCIACHKKQEKWNFREIGLRCTDCHKNIHESSMSADYFSGPGCLNCHDQSRWGKITFDHSKTGFIVSGPHATLTCRACHFTKDAGGLETQRFQDMSSNCSMCHKDDHNRQFDENGVTNCLRCHDPNVWKIADFDHNKTAFRLDGKHQGVPCSKCHKSKTENQNTFVLYKIKKTTCEDCH